MTRKSGSKLDKVFKFEIPGSSMEVIQIQNRVQSPATSISRFRRNWRSPANTALLFSFRPGNDEAMPKNRNCFSDCSRAGLGGRDVLFPKIR